jgi:hypothetical protein
MGTPTSAPDPNDLKHFMVSGSAGDFVFHEGDTSLECFVIRDGRVEILKTHHGQPRRLTLLGMGDLFGEGALFDEQSRDVSARAVTEFQLLRIDRATFQRIVQEDPSIAVSMARRLSRYLRVQRTVETPAGPPKLAVLIVPGTEQAFVLADREQWSVGRVGRSAAHKPDIDLTALDTEQSVSRKHATIVRKSGGYHVREERAANGTFVDGERIVAGREVELADGTHVSFGLVEMVFRYRDA